MPDPELHTSMTLPPSVEVSKPQIEAGMSVRQHAQDSKIPRFKRWNIRILGGNLGAHACTIARRFSKRNRQRTEGKAVLQRRDLTAKVPKLLGDGVCEKFRIPYVNDRNCQTYSVRKHDACLVVPVELHAPECSGTQPSELNSGRKTTTHTGTLGSDKIRRNTLGAIQDALCGNGVLLTEQASLALVGPMVGSISAQAKVLGFDVGKSGIKSDKETARGQAGTWHLGNSGSLPELNEINSLDAEVHKARIKAVLAVSA